MRVYAAELICSTGVLGFHTFKLALCIHNKLRSHAEILSWWAFDVTFPGSNPLRSNRSGLNVSDGGSWNPKLKLKVNGLWIKMKGQNFASQVLSRHTFRISRKKGGDFFDHRGTLNYSSTSGQQPQSHCAGEIWKTMFSLWIASRPHYAGELGKRDHSIAMTSSSSKKLRFEMFSVHTKTQSRRF